MTLRGQGQLERRHHTAMDSPLEVLKAELEGFGSSNDRSMSDRPRRMLNITRETGQFLSVLVRACQSRRVLEIGTSNGYSTLWLGEAAVAVGGGVTTFEISDTKADLALANISRAGLAQAISIVRGDAGDFLRQATEASFDLIFLDSERSQYAAWWPYLCRALRPGGLLVVDNATSHPDELAALVELIGRDPAFTSSVVPVGNGELMAVKAAS